MPKWMSSLMVGSLLLAALTAPGWAQEKDPSGNPSPVPQVVTEPVASPDSGRLTSGSQQPSGAPEARSPLQSPAPAEPAEVHSDHGEGSPVPTVIIHGF